MECIFLQIKNNIFILFNIKLTRYQSWMKIIEMSFKYDAQNLLT